MVKTRAHVRGGTITDGAAGDDNQHGRYQKRRTQRPPRKGERDNRERNKPGQNGASRPGQQNRDRCDRKVDQGHHANCATNGSDIAHHEVPRDRDADHQRQPEVIGVQAQSPCSARSTRPGLPCLKLFKTPTSGTNSPRQNATSSDCCSSSVRANSFTTQTLPSTWMHVSAMLERVRVRDGPQQRERGVSANRLANPKIMPGFRNRPVTTVVSRAAPKVASPTKRLSAADTRKDHDIPRHDEDEHPKQVASNPTHLITLSEGTLQAQTPGTRPRVVCFEPRGPTTTSARTSASSRT